MNRRCVCGVAGEFGGQPDCDGTSGELARGGGVTQRGRSWLGRVRRLPARRRTPAHCAAHAARGHARAAARLRFRLVDRLLVSTTRD